MSAVGDDGQPACFGQRTPFRVLGPQCMQAPVRSLQLLQQLSLLLPVLHNLRMAVEKCRDARFGPVPALTQLR